MPFTTLVRLSLSLMFAGALAATRLCGLEPGDVAVVGRTNNTSPDVLVFVALTELPAGTQLYFTDNGWTDAGFRGVTSADGDGSENLLKFTATTTIPAGTLVSSAATSPAFAWETNAAIPGTSAGSFKPLALAATDQIYIFEGGATHPLKNVTRHLFAFDDTGAFEPATSSTTGGLPPSLAVGSSAVTLSLANAGAISVQAARLAETHDRAGWQKVLCAAENWEAVTALPSTNLAVTNQPVSPPTPPPPPAPSSGTRIHDIQGAAEASPLVGQIVTVEAVVTGFVWTGETRDGFYVQEQDAEVDATPGTSEGLFVHAPNNPTVAGLVPGQVVLVTGTVKEFNGLTELAAPTRIEVVGTAEVPTAAPVALPLTSLSEWESIEGMRVVFAQPLTVTGNDALGQYGELLLSAHGRLVQPTHVMDPNDQDPRGTTSFGAGNAAAVNALQAANRLRTVLLDDANVRSFPDPTPYLGRVGSAPTRRLGDTVLNLTGILSYRFSAYRVDPQGPVYFSETNPRPAGAPEVGGATLRVASANVLNYFVTLTPPARGANSEEELARQRAKIVASLTTLNADVYGIMEVERHATNAALVDLVGALNARAGADSFAFVDSRAVAGTDAIQLALIYRRASVTPVGAPSTDTGPDASIHNRPPLAQTFRANANGAKFTVVVNHFKSKRPGGATGPDRDQADGQGAFNEQRRRQAAALLRFVSDPVERFGDPDVLIIGDLNAYAEEDPVDLLRAGGFVDLAQRFQGESGYSYNFSGQAGALDHALANAALAGQVTGAAEWHINADEPMFLDYNLERKSPAQRELNAATPYRSSDHDPLLVGLNLVP